MSAPPDYETLAARALLSRLASGDATRTITRPVGMTDARGVERSAVCGKVTVRTPSTNPQWYQDAIAPCDGPSPGESAMSGANIRDALECVASGQEPNAKQREARWIMARIRAAMADGDPALDLPPREGREPSADGKRSGGGAPRVAQAALKADGATVDRVPLRVPTAILDTLRLRARDAGVSLNCYLVGILAREAAGGGDVPF